jgi:D-3-phosphoglycerate dehydrogenase
MYKIRTYNAIAPIGLERFPTSGYEVNAEHESPDALLIRSHKLAAPDLNPGLRAVARAGAGTNNVPVDACSEKGIVVFNTPGANANC